MWKGTPKVTELEPVFNHALDWARYAANCWILWTTTEPDVWLERIRPHLGVDDNVVIAELALGTSPTNYTGWAGKWLWEWIKKPR
jgi:hypothetical protein